MGIRVLGLGPVCRAKRLRDKFGFQGSRAGTVVAMCGSQLGVRNFQLMKWCMITEAQIVDGWDGIFPNGGVIVLWMWGEYS